jgi:flavodoxin
MKCIIVLQSKHHKNTEKIGKAVAKILDAEIKTPQQTNPNELQAYSLVGFGSGIDSGRHYQELLDLAEKLPPVKDKRAFIFSTYGAPAGLIGQDTTIKNHSVLRKILQSRGYTIVDEFSCAGHNTNSFLILFGGINKGRPNSDDLKHAEEFAEKIKQTHHEGI